MDMVYSYFKMLFKPLGNVMLSNMGRVDQSWERWLYLWFLHIRQSCSLRCWDWSIVRRRNFGWKLKIDMNETRWGKAIVNWKRCLIKSKWSSRRTNLNYREGWAWKWIWFFRGWFRGREQYVQWNEKVIERSWRE